VVTEYSPEQHAKNGRSVRRIGLVLGVVIAGSWLFGRIDGGSVAILAVMALGMVGILWWLFVAASARSIPDPGPEARAAVRSGAIWGFWLKR
jgi:hypothetical protein